MCVVSVLSGNCGEVVQKGPRCQRPHSVVAAGSGFLVWAGFDLQVRVSWQMRDQKVPNRMRLDGHVAQYGLQSARRR